jgi:hypothetical protein
MLVKSVSSCGVYCVPCTALWIILGFHFHVNLLVAKLWSMGIVRDGGKGFKVSRSERDDPTFGGSWWARNLAHGYRYSTPGAACGCVDLPHRCIAAVTLTGRDTVTYYNVGAHLDMGWAPLDRGAFDVAASTEPEFMFLNRARLRVIAVKLCFRMLDPLSRLFGLRGSTVLRIHPLPLHACSM